MSIQIFNGVRNLSSTPGIITNTLANRPTASTLANGTLFYSSNTPDIYQVISGSWKACGGGGSQDFQSTLIVGSVLSQNNIADCNGHYFTFSNATGFGIFSNYLDVKDTSGVDTYFYVSTVVNGIVVGKASIDNWYKLEAVSGVYVYSHYTAGGDANYLKIDPNTNSYAIGDFYGTNNQTYIAIDDTGHKAVDIHADIFNIDEIQAGAGEIHFNGTGYLSNTAGSNSTNHLKVYVNGSLYKIQLKNP